MYHWGSGGTNCVVIVHAKRSYTKGASLVPPSSFGYFLLSKSTYRFTYLFLMPTNTHQKKPDQAPFGNGVAFKRTPPSYAGDF
jgi:hypothetical protein